MFSNDVGVKILNFFIAMIALLFSNFAIAESPDRAFKELDLLGNKRNYMVASCKEGSGSWHLMININNGSGLMFYKEGDVKRFVSQLTYTDRMARPLIESNGGMETINMLYLKYKSLVKLDFKLHVEFTEKDISNVTSICTT